MSSRLAKPWFRARGPAARFISGHSICESYLKRFNLDFRKFCTCDSSSGDLLHDLFSCRQFSQINFDPRFCGPEDLTSVPFLKSFLSFTQIRENFRRSQCQLFLWLFSGVLFSCLHLGTIHLYCFFCFYVIHFFPSLSYLVFGLFFRFLFSGGSFFSSSRCPLCHSIFIYIEGIPQRYDFLELYPFQLEICFSSPWIFLFWLLLVASSLPPPPFCLFLRGERERKETNKEINLKYNLRGLYSPFFLYVIFLFSIRF